MVKSIQLIDEKPQLILKQISNKAATFLKITWAEDNFKMLEI